MPQQPAFDRRCFVRRVVVQDDVDAHTRFCFQGVIQMIEELQELLVPMPSMTLADDLPGGHVERGKQGRGAVADVVVAAPQDRNLSDTRRRGGTRRPLFTDGQTGAFPFPRSRN